MSNIPLVPAAPTTRGASGRPSPAPWATARRIRRRIAAATFVTAVVGGLLVWAAAVPLGGLELNASGQTVGPVSIIVAAMAGGAAAWLLLALLIRRPHGRTWWTALGVTVLLLSLAGPPLSGAGGAVLVILELMHVLVGLVLILGLRRSTVPPPAGGRTVTAEAQ